MACWSITKPSAVVLSLQITIVDDQCVKSIDHGMCNLVQES